MVERFLIFHHFFAIINLSLTSKKTVKSLPLSLQNNIRYCEWFVIDNVSALPSPFLLITDKSLSDVDFSKKDIKSIRKLDLSKVHDYKMVSTCMPRYCNKSICKPLYVTFKSCLTQGNARHWNGNGMVMVKRKCTNVQIKKTRQKVC